MAKNIYQHLEDLTGERADLNYSKLASRYAEVAQATKDDDDRKAHAYRLNDKDLTDYHYSWMSKVVAKELEKEVDRVDGSLPISSVFEVFQSVKAASKANSRDIGLRVMASHLEKIWKRDKAANLTVSDFLKLKEHYTRNYPKSGATQVIEDATQKGYLTLPIGDLIDLTANIRSQEDYDYYIREAGLAGGNPFQRKARKFILALLNGEKSAQSLLDDWDLDTEEGFDFLDSGAPQEQAAPPSEDMSNVVNVIDQLQQQELPPESQQLLQQLKDSLV